MNYSKTYYAIIEHFRQNPHKDCGENHHIIPRSLGGSNKKDNIVRLSLRAHFVCHLLLVKMYQGKNKYKMIRSIHFMMTSRQGLKITSKQYENIRKEFIKIAGEKQRELVLNGTHHWLGGKEQKRTQRKKVKEGKHHFLDSNLQTELSMRAVKKHEERGTHPFSNTNPSRKKINEKRKQEKSNPFYGGKIQRETQQRLVKEGKHHLQGGKQQKAAWNKLTPEERKKRCEKTSIGRKRMFAIKRLKEGNPRPGDEKYLNEISYCKHRTE